MSFSILGGKSRKTAFSKMAPIGSGRTEISHLWSYFDKRKVNFDKFCQGNFISDIYFNLKHILEHEFKMAAANNVGTF